MHFWVQNKLTMLRIYIILSLGVLITTGAIAQPANDEPCNAIALTVAPNLEECAPTQTIQWAAATATNIPSPICASGQLLDVWYKFVAPANGKVNIRTSLPAGATNDGAMAVYSSASCNGPFTEVGCNDDYNGLNPGLNLTGLVAGQTYYIRFWSFSSSNGNYLVCLSNPAPTPPAIDPNKRVGINYDFPEANLDVNGTVIIRGGNPQPGRVLIATNDKGKMEWKDLSIPSPINRRLFKATMSANQNLTAVEARLQFDSKVYDIGNGYDPIDKKYLITDSIGAIYEFNLSITLSTRNLGTNVFIYVYQNGAIAHIMSYANIGANPGNYTTWLNTFTIKSITNQDEVYITCFSQSPPQIIYSGLVLNATSSYFSGQKIY
jgi:hypothetical protein